VKTTSKLPTLYAQPLPVNLADQLREKLRRVRRSTYGRDATLAYNLTGIAGDWRLAPVDYYVNPVRHKGRNGPFEVTERSVEFNPAKVNTDLDKRVFDSEALAWEWVTTEHARRVDANFEQYAKAEFDRAVVNRDVARLVLDEKQGIVSAWYSLLETGKKV
jgi:hypothetical protein